MLANDCFPRADFLPHSGAPHLWGGISSHKYLTLHHRKTTRVRIHAAAFPSPATCQSRCLKSRLKNRIKLLRFHQKDHLVGFRAVKGTNMPSTSFEVPEKYNYQNGFGNYHEYGE